MNLDSFHQEKYSIPVQKQAGVVQLYETGEGGALTVRFKNLYFSRIDAYPGWGPF